jgi:tRNA1Val (adenine37-N6)-methyltransferase
MSVFRFKEFTVDQENCPLKINTDGVLLGALAKVTHAKTILDIGTGTGVIALMLAQRNKLASITGLDIDENAYLKSKSNFFNSPFHHQLTAIHQDFRVYFDENLQVKYDLIISNPPYFLHALKSPKESKNLSKHTNEEFFLDLLNVSQNHLKTNGTLQLIVPVDVSLMLQKIASNFGLWLHQLINVKSYQDKEVIRHIVSFVNNEPTQVSTQEFYIYEKQGIHSSAYQSALKDFFTIF